MIFPVKCLSVSDVGRSEYFINVTSECIKNPVMPVALLCMNDTLF